MLFAIQRFLAKTDGMREDLFSIGVISLKFLTLLTVIRHRGD
jgi:hypothetical protein